MLVGPSPLAVLGLRPGCSRAEVDEAYRRLIKQHHPDLPGGDPGRAAELNWAYGVLKREGSGAAMPGRQTNVAAPPLVRPRRGRRLMSAGGLLAAGACLLLLPLPSLPVQPSTTLQPPHRTGARVRASPAQPGMAEFRPLPDSGSVTSGVAEAVRLARDGGSAASARYSRECAEDLEQYPGAALLDHCVAFDTAVATLLPGGSLEPQLTPEQMAERHATAAQALAGNPILADARVQVVRREAQRLAGGVSEAD
ncbi:J domain-containing protein [Sphingomonas sp. GCM10030256]|uniref:J domain-containing protein n=1 Tax=Sphingomonas sp. GCM10030256 TaxID=3273427 RepID=UPI0036106CA4